MKTQIILLFTFILLINLPILAQNPTHNKCKEEGLKMYPDDHDKAVQHYKECMKTPEKNEPIDTNKDPKDPHSICKDKAQERYPEDKLKARKYYKKCISDLEDIEEDKDDDKHIERAYGKRDTWYIGFGLGLGGSTFWNNQSGKEFANEAAVNNSLMESSGNGGINFGAGWTISNQLLLGFDLSSYSQLFEETGTYQGSIPYTYELSLNISTYNFMATYFPNNEGFFLRGGIGLANCSADSTLTSGVIAGSGTFSESGYGLIGGLGYSFWVLKSWNIPIWFDYAKQFINKSGLSETAFYSLNVGSYWY